MGPPEAGWAEVAGRASSLPLGDALLGCRGSRAAGGTESERSQGSRSATTMKGTKLRLSLVVGRLPLLTLLTSVSVREPGVGARTGLDRRVDRRDVALRSSDCASDA